MNEESKIGIVLSDASIAFALNVDCDTVRNSYQCPNGKRCKLLLDRDVGPAVVKKLRKDLWDPGQGGEERGNQKRRDRLEKRLQEMTVLNEDGTRDISFRLNGQTVCKHFYKVMHDRRVLIVS